MTSAFFWQKSVTVNDIKQEGFPWLLPTASRDLKWTGLTLVKLLDNQSSFYLPFMWQEFLGVFEVIFGHQNTSFW